MGEEMEVELDEQKVEISNNLLLSCFQNDKSRIQNLLNLYSDLKVSEIVDSKGFTILHVSALNDQYELIQSFIHYSMTNEQLSDEEMSNWINMQNSDGFTAMHYAAFRGNLSAIKLLENKGGDFNLKNNEGMSIMHIAAQGDQPISLVYFMNRGLDISMKDNKNSTPLHWACFFRCENAVNYLLSWGCDVMVPDTENGFTPLHLAVISGNSKNVRKLLLRGADRTIKDYEGKSPADIARENEFVNILSMLESEQTFCKEIFNVKPAFRPASRHKKSLYSFIAMFLGNIAMIALFLYPFVEHYQFTITFIVLASVCWVTFLFSWLKDPGYLKGKNTHPLIVQSALMKDLLNRVDSSHICPDCEIIKPLRSKHCEICKTCVKVYDHHCPWIDNCVGANNHKYFIAFVSSTWIFLLFVIISDAFYFLQNDIYNEPFVSIDYDKLKILKYVSIGFSGVISLGFFLPLSILLFIQSKNFLENKTTSERLGYNNQERSSESSNSSETNISLIESQDPQSRQGSIKKSKTSCSFLSNCGKMFWGNSKNKRYDYLNNSIL